MRRSCIFLMCLSCLASVSSADNGTRVGQQVDSFRLRDHRGTFRSLNDLADRITVIAFLGTECPLAKLYGPRLATLHSEYRARGVAFVGINSNAQDANTEIAAYARRHGIEFPMLKDSGNRVADQMSAVRTPEVFVLDADRRVRYWGRIDDQYGVGFVRSQPKRQDLRYAIDELLHGKSVSRPVAESVGCRIGRVRAPKPNAEVTYGNQIARLMQEHCVECHREGEIGPFTLTNYDDVAGWAETIAEVVRDQRMPPWHANPQHGEFLNARFMTLKEKELIYRWVRDGAPEGDPKQRPAPRPFTTGWRLAQRPHQVIAMRDRPFEVPAEATVEYQYFVVDPKFTEDKWISAAEVIPGNRAVVHHAIVFFRPPPNYAGPGTGWLTAYVPGQSTMELATGQARFLPAGSKLIFQMHYTPTGSTQRDITKVGLIFADPKAVREEVVTMVAIDRNFEIPPGAANFPVRANLTGFPPDSKLLAIAPHAHLRGRSFRVISHEGNTEKILLDVPNYDFNWQHAYVLREPLRLGKQVQLQTLAHYDNSDDNLVNPDPTATVRWGDQTWEEMMVTFFQIALPRGKANWQVQTARPLTKSERQRVERATTLLFRRFDKNKDGVLQRDEVPESFGAFAFDRFDQDGNAEITSIEATAAGERSLRRKQRQR